MENQKIVLSFVCGTTWDDMLPVENGRFCTGCQKTVVDFVGKSDLEIAHFLNQQKSPICGRFTDEQAKPKHVLPFPPTHLWKNIATGLLFATSFGACKTIGSPAFVDNSHKVEIPSSVENQIEGVGKLSAVQDGLPKIPHPYDTTAPENQKEFLFGEVTEIMPEPIGGIIGMQARAVNPDSSFGRVIMQFTVTETGIVENAKILVASIGISEAAKAVALQVLQETLFTPVEQLGKPIKVKMSIPIRFRNNE